jgi:hypothetical protein
LNVLTSLPAPRASHPCANAGAGLRPKRCALTQLPIVCLEALTCLFHAVHATDACGSPLSAFPRESPG